MRELFDIIRVNPWPFGAGLFVVILMIIAENFGRGIQGDGAAGGDFGGCDGGDGGGCD
ncbi:hypothetical protein [uncultured Bradyrhizobium sp.]|jgi:hypothetical protein|uniref:hypothetical protein n=1 Tax=uncultured Bradyrhizobium sp. TaxID=199684 RepID=UPI00261730A9|nr:hypothetical protein [uncultured Bradyrhizobium sp.]